MSGPKCVGLSSTERYSLFEDNRLLCDTLQARYSRLAHERDRLANGTPPKAPRFEAIRKDVAELLKVWYDCEAVQYLESHLEKLREEIKALREAGTPASTATPRAETTPEEAPRQLSQDEAKALRAQATGDSARPNLQETLDALRHHPAPPASDPLAAKLQPILDRLVIIDPARWQKLYERASAVQCEPDAAHRRRLYESLLLQADAELKLARGLAEQHEALAEMADELSACHSAEADLLRTEIAALRHKNEEISLHAIRLRVAETTDAERERRERERRRQAVLDSLAELGYETREGMATALVEGGRVVVHRPEETDYAVEVVANEDLSLLQTSMVRFGDDEEMTDQQRLRDRERETAWCADHGALLQRLAQMGIETNFRMQLEPGAHPVRVVPSEGAPTSHPRGADRPAPKEREL